MSTGPLVNIGLTEMNFKKFECLAIICRLKTENFGGGKAENTMNIIVFRQFWQREILIYESVINQSKLDRSVISKLI